MTIAYLITYVLYNFADYFVDGFEYVLEKVPPLFFYMIPLIAVFKWMAELRNKLVAGIPIIGATMVLFFMVIDFGTKNIEFVLSTIISTGCINPNKQKLNKLNHQNGGAIKLNALLLKYFQK